MSAHKSHIPGRSGDVIERKLIPQSDGSTAIELHIDLRQLPTPDRSYVADQARLQIDADLIQFQFAQQTISRSTLRSVVVVTLFPEAVRTFLKTCATIWPGLQAVMQRNAPVAPTKLVQITDEPSQVVALRANMIAASYSNREAELQFFYVSPLELHRSSSRDVKSAVEPVVRVHISTPMLYELINELMHVELPREWK